MKILAVLAITIMASNFAQAAQKTECLSYSRGIMKLAMHGDTTAAFKLVKVEKLKVANELADVAENIEKLTFQSEAATVVVKTLPNYYEKGQCELKNITISRQ